MKKFLIYLVIIVVAVGMGFSIFYLTRNNEIISLSTSMVYMYKGETNKDLKLKWKNKKAFSKYEVVSSNDKIARYDKDKQELIGVGGGIATITFRSTNIKYRNLSCQVYVGDGSISAPFFINDVNTLKRIGQTVDGVTFGLDKCYKLMNNIDLADGYDGTGFWIPIGVDSVNGFTGNFNGNGKTIFNLSIDRKLYNDTVSTIPVKEHTFNNYSNYTNFGLFSKIGVNGIVSNLKINTANINLNGTDEVNAGVLAGENNGYIERVEIKDAYITGELSTSSNVGGIVGYNQSYASADGDDRQIAKITRSSAEIYLGKDKTIENQTDSALKIYQGKVAGAVGQNIGGIITYVYTEGEAYLNNDISNFGGIVGINQFKQVKQNAKYEYDYMGANVKSTYSTIKINSQVSELNDCNWGRVIGWNIDQYINEDKKDDDFLNKYNIVTGSYYLIDENANVNVEILAIGKNEMIPKQESAETEVTKDYEYDSFIVCKGLYKNQFNNVNSYLDYGLNTEHDEVGTLWDFSSIWYFDGDHVGPVLNMSELSVSDNLKYTTNTITGNWLNLQDIKPDGHYTLSCDIDMANAQWRPIGTKSRPFIGSLNGMKEGVQYVISNLTVDTIEHPELSENGVAGLFGYVGNGAEISNIILFNANITGVDAGGIAAYNGFTKVTETGEIQTFKGGNITNCIMKKSLITGKRYAGGITAYNYGNVTNCKVMHDDSKGGFGGSSNVVLEAEDGYNNYALGGIVGYNLSNIIGKSASEEGNMTATISGETRIEFKSSLNSLGADQYNVGGIAGFSSGSGVISNCYIKNNLDNVTEKGAIISTGKSYVGGIVGKLESGIIDSTIVSININAKQDQQTVVGGLVGAILETGQLKNSIIKNSSLLGESVGGLVGYIHSAGNFGQYLINPSSFDHSVLDKRNKNKTDTVINCAVLESTSLNGSKIGGLVEEIENGIMSNCYTLATLQGSNNAGFAYRIKRTANCETCGFITNSYASVKFGSGTNYAITLEKNDVTPLIALYQFINKGFNINDAESNNNLITGYIVNYLFDESKGGIKPKCSTIGFLGSNGDSAPQKELKAATTTTSSLKDGNSKAQLPVDDGWVCSSGEMPYLKALKDLEIKFNLI